MDEQIVPIFRVSSAASAVKWYERLGFRQEWEHRFEPHLPAFVCVSRGKVRLFLSEHTGDAQRDALVYFWVADVHAVAKEFQTQVRETLWAQEIELRDPDGNRLGIGTAKS